MTQIRAPVQHTLVCSSYRAKVLISHVNAYGMPNGRHISLDHVIFRRLTKGEQGGTIVETGLWRKGCNTAAVEIIV